MKNPNVEFSVRERTGNKNWIREHSDYGMGWADLKWTFDIMTSKVIRKKIYYKDVTSEASQKNIRKVRKTSSQKDVFFNPVQWSSILRQLVT